MRVLRTQPMQVGSRRGSGVWPALVAFGIGGLAFLAIGAVQALGSTELWQDPPVTTREPFYLGLGSNLGVLLWGATVVVCVFTWIALRGQPAGERFGRPLLAATALTMVLLADDLLILHERVFPTELGLSEVEMMAIYGVAGIACLLVAFRLIRESPDKVLLVSTIVLFAVALALDVVDETSVVITGTGTAEDAAEFLGIVGWLAFWSRTCLRLLAPTSSSVAAFRSSQ